ncbi:MAG: carbohydrate porin [Pseudobdellovibrionaceae bacterium]
MKTIQGIAIASLLLCFNFISEQCRADYTFHTQATVITQGHYPFTSPYEGQNSLLSHEDAQTSLTMTFFSGLSLGPVGEIYFDPELSGGSGLSKTQGIAGFPNAEIYRVDKASPIWSLARIYIKKVFGFGGETEKIEDDKNQLARSYDVNRFTVTLGKFALNDFFDNNSLSHDPRTQFFNWGLMDYGAWDYAADTKGYSWGVVFELNQKNWALRFASVLEPEQANQMTYDMNLEKARGDNLEFEYRYSHKDQPGVVRLLAFNNHAHMGNYRDAINAPSPTKDITLSRRYSDKTGFGIGVEQKLNPDLGVFSRISWNDGKSETWAFTEIDQSISAGISWNPHLWSNLSDTIGTAVVANDLSKDHRDYLAAGGYGFIIGDGKMTYASEQILEAYYLIHPTKESAVTLDYQFVANPAYNSDRGPASIFGIRLHHEI